MATTPVIPAAASEPSMTDLRAMIATTAPATEPKPATSEPAAEKPAEANTQQTATEPVETKPEPVTEEPAEELPEGVKKRIAKEVKKATEIQAEIDRAVSQRKAKEDELAKLKGDTSSGSQPATEPAKAPAKPQKPSFGEKGHEAETWEQYEARTATYDDAREKWLKDETIREFQEKQTADQRKAKAKEAWDAAVKTHGAEFPAQMDTVIAGAPEGLQLAISSLEHWDTVAVHLAKEPAKLKQLADQFQANPYAAVATLGRIEAALTPKQEPTTATTTEKPLPEPLAKVGGSASASGKDFQSTLETGSMSQFKATVNKARGIK